MRYRPGVTVRLNVPVASVEVEDVLGPVAVTLAFASGSPAEVRTTQVMTALVDCAKAELPHQRKAMSAIQMIRAKETSTLEWRVFYTSPR